MSNKKNLTFDQTFNLAVQNHQEGKIDIAQELYSQVLKINPNHSSTLNNFALIFQGSGENQKAKDCLEKAIEINPDYATAHNNLGNIFKELGENQKAKECYEKAITINPDYAGAHNNLGVILQKLGENQKAKECYEKVIEINPNYTDAHNNLGVLFQGLGEYRKAKECFEKAIEINPNYINALNNLGVIFKELEENQKAKECCEKAIKINPNYVDAHYNLSIVLEKLSRLDEAEASYRKAIEIKPDYLAAHKNLGILLKQKRLLSKIKQAKKSEIKTKINFFKKVPEKLLGSGLRLSSNPFISSLKVEAELISQLYKINSKKLDDVDPVYLRYGNGRSSDYELFKNDISTIKNVEKDLINIMKEAVKSDIFIMESFFNIFQTGSGVISHNHMINFDVTFGLLNQKFSLTYYLDIGDQNCSEPGILKLQDPDKEILPSEGMIIIFPASRKHSAVYNGVKDRVMIGINFYSLI